MARAAITITLVPGTPRLGLWCDTCLTSARYEIDFYLFAGNSAYITKTIKRCDRCDDEGCER